MAIVALSKITLYGRQQQRDEVLRGLQQLGCVHLVDLHGVAKPEQSQEANHSEVHEAIRYLAACPDRRPPAGHDVEYDAHRTSRRALIIKQAQQDLNEERERLQRAIAATLPWGDFHLPTPESLGGQHIWLYRFKHDEAKELEDSGLVWQVISRTSRYINVAIVSASRPVGLSGRAVHLDPRSRSELRRRLSEVERTLERLALERIALTRWIPRLTTDMEAADDERRFNVAASHLWDDGPLFALRGWAPRQQRQQIEAFARQHGLALTVHRPTPREKPPTLLKNPAVVAGAEGAVTFYMTPSYWAWDPTWLMFVSFSLFFAMIMADAGYGLLLAGLLALAAPRLGRTPTGRRMRGLLIAIVSMTILYGILIGSYFGFAPPPESLADRLVWKRGGLSIMHDQTSMMLIAAGIGVVHLVVANLISAWNQRRTSRLIGHLGWACGLIGGLVLALAGIEGVPLVPWLADRLPLAEQPLRAKMWGAGSVLLGGGLAAVLAFSSDRPLLSRKIGDWAWRPVAGLLALTNVTKAFGDSLSYLRLFALGLASSSLAVTFNGLAAEVIDISGVGLLLAGMIFLVGHGLNLVLGIVGGVVHGLRLNCIEFFSWSLTEEGYPFRAFRKKAG